ncbi:MAG: AEC family transporter [Calothrix sp. MO_192.B10]|nr:AEC family transporter [Calothrix sp. MO_192.B10]
MIQTLLHAYTPLILWTTLGLFVFRFFPQWFPHLLGRCLYWIGIPLELLALSRRNHLDEVSDGGGFTFLVPILTVGALAIGAIAAILALWIWQRLVCKSQIWDEPSNRGSFVLASVLGNTGFIGLAIAPHLVNSEAITWALVYSLTQNIIGTYVFGVAIASYFSHTQTTHRWWKQLQAIVSVPSLWAFFIGYLTRQVPLPELIESSLQGSIDIVIPCAFILTGIRLSQLQGWKSLQLSLVPVFLKVGLTPLLVALFTTFCFGLSGDRRFAIVLMSGMPSAFAALILAEEYNLNRDLIASSIFVSIVAFVLVLPLWIVMFD